MARSLVNGLVGIGTSSNLKWGLKDHCVGLRPLHPFLSH